MCISLCAIARFNHLYFSGLHIQIEMGFAPCPSTVPTMLFAY